MDGLTNYELEKYCKKYLGKCFIGVYPSDAQPKNFKKRKKVSVIFNLSPHYETGSHFVAILKKNNKLIYFDSFGEKCNNENIIKFLKNITSKLYFNLKPIQSKNSYFCGLFCLAFLIICQKKNKSLKHFQNLFPNSINKNDKIVLNIILSNFKSK
jgi:hypothetical protein